MTTPFLAFSEAESTALEMADKEFHSGLPCMGLMFINQGHASKAWREYEKSWAVRIQLDAIKGFKRKYLERYIITGLVPDCKLSRRFMSHMPLFS